MLSASSEAVYLGPERSVEWRDLQAVFFGELLSGDSEPRSFLHQRWTVWCQLIAFGGNFQAGTGRSASGKSRPFDPVV